MNHVIFSISSNTPDREQKIHEAIEEMKALFPDIKTSAAYTSAAFNGRDPEYMTVAATADTDLPIDRLTTFTKAMEWQIGRSADDSKIGLITIDIDIIVYEGTVIKQRDLAHEPFAEALNSIK